MAIFFTSDLHFEHANIIKYCNRPFINVEAMNRELIKRWNNYVKHDDLVYCVGDMIHCPRSKGRIRYFEAILNGQIVHIYGNHKSEQSYLYKCIMHFGGKSVFVTHRPSHTKAEIPKGTDFCICGHVHNLYKHKWVEDIPVINVSVDVWNFQPVSTESILKYYKKLRSERDE